jgi:acetylornithine deacetylase/succinyl-diaminopimelate desuccinylase-like protein
LAWTWPTEIELLRDLVAIPSVSGTEEAIGRFVEERARGWGLSVARGDDGVLVTLDGGRPGPSLAFVSHLDTVPAGEGWTRPPFEPVIEGTTLYGRGSGDAKASVAAMLTAARDLSGELAALRGRLVLLLGYGEETRATSMPALAARAGAVDAAVVGEPTNLEVAIAQRGLLMADLVAHGAPSPCWQRTSSDWTVSSTTGPIRCWVRPPSPRP